MMSLKETLFSTIRQHLLTDLTKTVANKFKLDVVHVRKFINKYCDNQLPISSQTNNDDKQTIIKIFRENVKDQFFSKNNNLHDGEEGHWVEKQMGVKPNRDNNPDILGYEIKKEAKKITFFDKVPDEFYFEGKIIGRNDKNTKQKYWRTFQRTNSNGCRIGGWKLERWDCDGQCLKTDSTHNINIVYNFTMDKRFDKKQRVSVYYHNDTDHIIGRWQYNSLKNTLEKKFNQNGFIICKKNNNMYNKICFGKPINFTFWFQEFKKGNIVYDGYSKVDGRFRGAFRSPLSLITNLINEEYQ